MQTKLATSLTIILSLFLLAHSMSPECTSHLKGLSKTFDILQYSAQDQDVLGVFRALRLLSKGKNSVYEVCGDEVLDFFGEEEYDTVQGCQGSSAYLEEILEEVYDEIHSEEESLKAIRKLERFYPIFQQTCLNADDDFGMNVSEEANDEIMEALEELMQELLDKQERLVDEIFDDLEDLKTEIGKKDLVWN